MALSRREFGLATLAAAAATEFLQVGSASSSQLPDDALLRRLSRQGLAARLASHGHPHYWSRLESELDVIGARPGLASTFLLQHEAVAWARTQGIPVGAGHGAAPSSLVCWSLGLTDVDPIEHGLIFERFINWRRPGYPIPSVCVDVCALRREEIVRHVIAKYGREHVAFAVTHDMARGHLLRAACELDISYEEREPVFDLLPPGRIGVEQAIATQASLARLYATDECMSQWFDLAISWERGLFGEVPGWHEATTLVIGDRPLEEYASCFDDDRGRRFVELEADDAGLAGLNIFHCLRLRTLTEIEATGVDIGEPDAVVYEMLSRGDTDGVFQLDSASMQEFLRQVRPGNLEDVLAAIALFRPNTLESGRAAQYIERKHGRASYHIEPALEPILGPTHGVIVYQEQVMQVASAVAGFDLGQAELLRRALGRRKPGEVATWAEEFGRGAAACGIDAKTADSLFERLACDIDFAFNRSHAVAYAPLTMRTAWLKAHAPRKLEQAIRVVNTALVSGSRMDDCGA